jgi:hypothetical protein
MISQLNLQGAISELGVNFKMLDFGTDSAILNGVEILGTFLLVVLVCLFFWVLTQMCRRNNFIKKVNSAMMRSLKYNTPIRFMIETCLLAFLCFSI